MVSLIMNMLSMRFGRAFTLVLGLGGTLAACGDDAAEGGDSGSMEASSSTAGATLGTTGSGDASSGSSSTTDDAATTSGLSETTSSPGPESTGGSDTEADGEVTVLEGFSTPESAHWHAASETWFISNIAGESGVPDGEGWITRLDGELAVTQMQWFDGLNSPAGLVSNETTLFVADIDRVLAIDIVTGHLDEQWTVEGAGLLNDPALHADRSVYVSDTFGQAIHRLEPGTAPQLVLQDPQLGGPNGLNVTGDVLTIVSTGSFTDFEEEASAFRLDLVTDGLTELPEVRGKFDGIEPDGDGYLLTDFRGSLLRLDASEQLHVIRDFVGEGLVSSTADLGFDAERGRVGIPDLLGDRVLFYDMD